MDHFWYSRLVLIRVNETELQYQTWPWTKVALFLETVFYGSPYKCIFNHTRTVCVPFTPRKDPSNNRLGLSVKRYQKK